MEVNASAPQSPKRDVCANQEKRMSSVDHEPPRLYAAREPIFPRRVSGTFRRLKWVLMAITLGIYYITPWIRGQGQA